MEIHDSSDFVSNQNTSLVLLFPEFLGIFVEKQAIITEVWFLFLVMIKMHWGRGKA